MFTYVPCAFMDGTLKNQAQLLWMSKVANVTNGADHAPAKYASNRSIPAEAVREAVRRPVVQAISPQIFGFTGSSLDMFLFTSPSNGS